MTFEVAKLNFFLDLSFDKLYPRISSDAIEYVCIQPSSTLFVPQHQPRSLISQRRYIVFQSRDRTRSESKRLQVMQNNGVVAGYNKCELLIKSRRVEMLFIKCTSPRNPRNKEDYVTNSTLRARSDGSSVHTNHGGPCCIESAQCREITTRCSPNAQIFFVALTHSAVDSLQLVYCFMKYVLSA